MSKESSTLFVGADGPELDELARAILERGGDVVRVSAEEALELEGRFAAAVVMLDAPGAVAAIESLRRGSRDVPILALVSSSDLEGAVAAKRAEADDVIFLPASDAELRFRLDMVRAAGRARSAHSRDDDDTKLMFDLTQALASSLDFEDILYTVVHRIAEVVQVDRCSIILTGVSPLKGYVVASSEDPEIRDLPIELSKYPEVQKVLRDAEPLVIDVGTDPLLDEVRSSIPPGGPATSALFPIMHESRVMGVLFLRFVAHRQELTERELVLCQAVANATAIALRNARFVHALRDEQARISLAHSEAERKVEALSHYADFFESSADGMLVVDAEGAVLYANPRMAALTGRSVSELTTCSLADLVTESEHAVLGRLLAGFSRGAYPRGLDLEFRAPFDETVVLSVSASSTLKLAQGVLLILRDVTAARATERELRRTKEFLEALIAQSVDAVIASDMQGHIMLFNPAAERVLGYDANEILGKPVIEDLYPPGVARRIMALLRSPAHGGVGRLEQTRATILAKDGTEVPISMTGGMIYEYGKPRATFGIFTDLRERLEIENNLARMRVELMEREREAIAAQLAGAAAHELNQPLTSVMASVELLQRKLGDDAAHRSMVDIIVAETERMARIVRKIGKITHYETTAYVGSTRIIDLERSAEPSEEIAAQTGDLGLGFTEEGDEEDTDVGRPRSFVKSLRAEVTKEEQLVSRSVMARELDVPDAEDADDDEVTEGSVQIPHHAEVIAGGALERQELDEEGDEPTGGSIEASAEPDDEVTDASIVVPDPPPLSGDDVPGGGEVSPVPQEARMDESDEVAARSDLDDEAPSLRDTSLDGGSPIPEQLEAVGSDDEDRP